MYLPDEVAASLLDVLSKTSERVSAAHKQFDADTASTVRTLNEAKERDAARPQHAAGLYACVAAVQKAWDACGRYPDTSSEIARLDAAILAAVTAANDVPQRTARSARVRVRLFLQPKGTRFWYVGHPEARNCWVLLDHCGTGLVAECQPPNTATDGTRSPFQSLCSAADSEAAFEALIVEVEA